MPRFTITFNQSLLTVLKYPVEDITELVIKNSKCALEPREIKVLQELKNLKTLKIYSYEWENINEIVNTHTTLKKLVLYNCPMLTTINQEKAISLVVYGSPLLLDENIAPTPNMIAIAMSNCLNITGECFMGARSIICDCLVSFTEEMLMKIVAHRVPKSLRLKRMHFTPSNLPPIKNYNLC